MTGGVARSSDRVEMAASLNGRRIGFAGPMLGGNPGWVTSQHEILAARFRADGATVYETSHRPQRVLRLADTLTTIATWRGRVDCVIIAVYSGPAFQVADLSSRLARRCGLPQVLVLHGGDLPSYADRHPHRVGTCLARAGAIVAPSAYLASEVRSASAIRVIPNSFDIESIAHRRRDEIEPKLLWMRTFHEIYNPLLALDVLARVRGRHPGATLTMAGQEKGMSSACHQRARELGLDDAVTFPGFLDEDQKLRAFADHDVFLNTNDVDNSPVSVLEAAAAGLPVVATDVGGLPYLFQDGESALLRPRGDGASLAAAVETILSTPALTEKLSASGRVVAEQSSWPRVRGLWIEAMDDVAPTGR